ncbi:DUF2913 family protein [Shewanella sp. AS1]|uniref:DUF2913 family protein n=1 Tax=Shewanella sp. AS1 TaxID=2907626 RepID=UPI001F24D216|nr:DUF2913 family protein [Shewanella sp. AS1]MCE9677888.1 DUF2913 family protein [Shewanella sp. AS1]
MTQNYNQALLELAQAGLDAVNQHTATASIKTAAAQSHFLCNWMVQAQKSKRFSKLIAGDLTLWIRQGRSMGAGANLKGLLETIVSQYQQLGDSRQLGKKLSLWLEELTSQEWIIYTDTKVDTKLKLDSDGEASLIISADEFSQHIDNDELIKPINLYVRADETQLASSALRHGLLLSQGNKKSSLIKHHKTYRLYPGNLQPALALLAKLD